MARGRRRAKGCLVARRLERPWLLTHLHSCARLRALPPAALAVVGGAAAAAPPHGAAAPRGRAAAAAQRLGRRAAQPLDDGPHQAHLRPHAQRLRRLQRHRCATETLGHGCPPSSRPLTSTPAHIHVRARPRTPTPARARSRLLTPAPATPRAAGLILWSVYVSGAIVTPLQYVGYFVALVGVVGFSEYKRANATASKVLPSEANAEKVPLSTADAESAADTHAGSPALTPTR